MEIRIYNFSNLSHFVFSHNNHVRILTIKIKGTSYFQPDNDNTVDSSLYGTRKGPRNLFDLERARDRERKLGWNQWKGTEVRDR